MIWLTWRQFRLQATVIAAAVAVLAVAALVTGPALADLKGTYSEGFLGHAALDFAYRALYVVGIVVSWAIAPIIGAFWGAPLVAREIENGTHRLIWSQSVSRTRWLAVKLGFVALTAAVVTGVLAAALTWWAGPIDQAVAGGDGARPFSLPRISPVVFIARGVVPIGYGVFAVALGTLIGLVIRKTVPAIALTIALVVAVEVAMPFFVRPHLARATALTTVISSSNVKGLMVQGDPTNGPTGRVFDLRVDAGGPGDWELTNVPVNRAGKAQKSLASWVGYCAPDAAQNDLPTAGKQRAAACYARLSAEGYRQHVTYQPAANFWALQWRETALLLIVAALLSGLSFARIWRA